MALLFDTHVQKMKYNVLREVAKLAYRDELTPQRIMEIAPRIIPEGKPMFRCCIYKERAIINERVSMALGGEEDGTVVGVLPIACDECPVDGIQVSNACRGCLAHRCKDNCPKDAISIVDHKAVIDKEKCIECGKCMAVCPYSAIVKHTRPCVNACKPQAIHIDQNTEKAVIDKEKCISCGACVYQCPFGAIMDKSYILDTIDIIKKSENNTKYKVYAVVAPSISSQFSYAELGSVVTGIKKLGFHAVVEAALGADMVAYSEAAELYEKGFLISSCCPAFVDYVEKNFPDLAGNISHNLSPMAAISKYIKEKDETARIVFIGPCTAKKMEAARPEFIHDGRPDVDLVLTTHEVIDMMQETGIQLNELELESPDLPFGLGSGAAVIYGTTGGVAEAVVRHCLPDKSKNALREISILGLRGDAPIKETTVTIGDTELKLAVVNGLANARKLLKRIDEGEAFYHLIEVMTCQGGCVGGAGQPYGLKATKEKRGDGLHQSDNAAMFKRAERNPIVVRMMAEYGEERCHELLHVSYRGE